MLQCPECGADGRIGKVKEEHGKVEMEYICPNKRCVHYGQSIGTETMQSNE